MDEEEREHRLRIVQLLEAIIRRLDEPIKVDVTIRVVNAAGPAVSVDLEPQKPIDQ
jgi:hypothetical protein